MGDKLRGIRRTNPVSRKRPSPRCAEPFPGHSSNASRSSFTGEASYNGAYRHLKLNWIPVSKKNRTRATIMRGKASSQAGKGRSKILWIPDSKVQEHSNAIKVIARSEICPPCDSESEFRIEIVVLRRTPQEEKSGKRNSRRGDLVNMPGLICDALEGVWWGNDEQITDVKMFELRRQKADEFHIYAWRRSNEEDGVRTVWGGDSGS